MKASSQSEIDIRSEFTKKVIIRRGIIRVSDKLLMCLL